VDRDFSNLTISIIDNSPRIRKTVRRVLRSFGVPDGPDFSNGTSALAQFRHTLPDIVILDVDVTPTDGIEITMFIRQSLHSSNPYLPIIMMVGNSDPRRVVAARDVGATEIIAKPLSAPSLYGRITQVLDHPRRYIRTTSYFGPDRRRRNTLWVGRERRVTEYDSYASMFIDVQ
jgi:two-component system, chemotaxis family, chemotaxis protein CheY